MAIVVLNENHTDGLTVASLNLTITVSSGDTVIVTVDEALGTVSSVTDTGGSTYSQLATVTGVRQTEIWGVLSAAASTSVTVNFSGSVNANVCVQTFSGVTSFGRTATATSTGSDRSLSVETQHSNNYIAGGYGDDGTIGTVTVTSGTLVVQAFANAQGSQYLTAGFHTIGSTGSTNLSYTSTTARSWQGAIVELCSEQPLRVLAAYNSFPRNVLATSSFPGVGGSGPT